MRELDDLAPKKGPIAPVDLPPTASVVAPEAPGAAVGKAAPSVPDVNRAEVAAFERAISASLAGDGMPAQQLADRFRNMAFADPDMAPSAGVAMTLLQVPWTPGSTATASEGERREQKAERAPTSPHVTQRSTQGPLERPRTSGASNAGEPGQRPRSVEQRSAGSHRKL